MDYLSIGDSMLHGAKVAICARFCLYLQKSVNKRLNEFFNEFKILKTLPVLMNLVKQILLNYLI